MNSFPLPIIIIFGLMGLALIGLVTYERYAPFHWLVEALVTEYRRSGSEGLSKRVKTLPIRGYIDWKITSFDENPNWVNFGVIDEEGNKYFIRQMIGEKYKFSQSAHNYLFIDGDFRFAVNKLTKLSTTFLIAEVRNNQFVLVDVL